MLTFLLVDLIVLSIRYDRPDERRGGGGGRGGGRDRSRSRSRSRSRDRRWEYERLHLVCTFTRCPKKQLTEWCGSPKILIKIESLCGQIFPWKGTRFWRAWSLYVLVKKVQKETIFKDGVPPVHLILSVATARDVSNWCLSSILLATFFLRHPVCTLYIV